MSDLQSKMRAARERAFPPADEVIAARLQSEQGQNPDEAAAALADADALGLDPEVAVKNRVVLRHRMERERKRQEAAHLAASRTTLAQMIEEEGGFAALTHDDLDNLSAVEKGANLFRSAAAGLTQLPGSVLGGIEAIGQNVRQRGLNREAAEFLGPLGLTPEESRQFADRARRSIVGQGADISKGAADFLRPDQQGFVGQVSEGLGQVAGQGALFVATGGGSTATLLLQGVDQQAERIGDENIDPNRELLALGLGGAATAISERIGLGRIFRGAPGTELLRRNLLREVGESALAEGASEALEGVLQNAIERGLYNPEADIIDVGDTANDATVGAAVGAVMRGLVMASLPGRARIEQAESDAQALGDVMDAASSTRLMGRRRQSLEDFLGRITEGQQVYLPAQSAVELFQSAGEQDVAAALGVEESALGDALLEGGDVAVSAAKVITLADRPYAEGIKEIVRLRPDSLNLREAQSEELQDEIRREFDELVASGREQFADLNAIQEIEQNVADQLIASGEKPNIAQTQAAVWGAAFETLQGRYGIDPTETFERLGLRIEGPEQARPLPQIDELDLLLDRLRAGERSQPDSPSLLDFARERGVTVTEGVEGELRAIAENAPRRPGLRGIIQDDGVSIDALGELAADAGYFEVRPDQNEVLDALDREARGDGALYPAGSNASEVLEQNDLLDQIESELVAAGVDLSEADNQAARAALNESVLNQFAGVSAANADIASLNRARQLIDDGKTAREVWEATGWFRGGDGAWRFELSDQDATLTLGDDQEFLSGKLGDILQHQELFEAYPDLANIFLELEISPESRPSGSWSPGTPDTDEFFGRDEQVSIRARDAKEARSLLLHEIQHAIQDRENFSRGGASAAIRSELENIRDGFSTPGLSDGPGLVDYLASLSDGQLNRVAFLAYRSLSGEVEARNVERRAAKPASMSKLLMPGETEDVPKGDQLQDAERLDGVFAAISGAVERGDVSLNQSGDQPRASVTLELGNALGDREVLVRLGEASDVTSFLHESAHVFLEIYRGLAADNSELSAELETITEALGVESGGAIEREHHERFAEQFEAFLAEGKAPSKGLDAAFQRFRAWFTRVYDRLRGRLPKLSPEARDFFSRMLATDGQIEEAQRSNGFRLSELMEGLMTPDQIERYRKAGERARQFAEDRLTQRALKEFSAAERQRVEDARNELRPQIEAEVMARPVNRAFHLLTSGELPGTQETPEFLRGRRLSREAVTALRGEAFLKRVVKDGARALYTTKKGEVGADPEAVAVAAGFPSGDALLLALVNTKTPREQVSEEVEQAIRERFGDYEADGTLERDAADAVMNDHQAKVLTAEQAALAKKALGGGMSLAEIKAVAAELIELRPMSRAIQPKQYLRVMRNKGVEAIRETSKENWFVALKAKQQQLLNHELARLAVDAARERMLIQQEVKRKQNPKKLSARDYPPAFIDAMQMLANLPGAEDQATARRAINAAVSKISEEFGVSPILPTALAAEQDVPRLNDMTLAQARELRASLRGLVKLGRAEGRAALEKRKALRAQAADVIRSNRDERGGAVFQSGGQERGGVARRTLEEVHWSNRRLDFITQRFDGGGDGFFTEQIWEPLSKAADEEGRRNERDQDWWEALLKDHGVTPVEVARHVDEPTLFGGQQVPFGALLEMAQHLGSQSNLDRLLADPRWAKVGTRPSLEAIMEVLNRRLEARHWALVQARWDHLESKWPEIAALEERVSGIAPEKVIERAVETNAGVLRGGYYPLSYEGGVQSAASQDIAAGLANPPSTATTRHGFTQSRVKNVSRPLALAFGGDLLHHAEVNHDLTHREPIKEIAALFAGDASSNPLVGAINETYGKSALDAVTTILRRVGTGPEMATDVLSQVTRFLRRNYATSLLAGSVRTALLQLPGLAVAIQHSGRRTFTRGFLSTWKNPAEAIRVMRAKSSFMDGRLHTRQNDQRVRIEGEPFERYLNSSTLTARSKSAFRKVNETLYLPMAWLEASVVSAPLWHGVYSQELEAGTEESLAISRADRAVSQTAGSGRLMDRTTWQTSGNELLRSLTFLGGYSIAMYNHATNTAVRPDRPLPRRAVDFLGFVFAAAIFPGLFEHLLLSPDDGDDEDNLQDLLVDSIFWQQIVPMLPLGGVVNSTRYGGGSQRVDVALQDASRAGGELWDVAEAAFDPSADVGEEALDFFADGLPPIMMLTGLGGAAQVNRTLDTIVKDDDPTLEEAIITGPDRR